ncbi:unnamed protein product [Rotaria sp. Silwood1]|nr:unnamed protein product [Rotaria sp. Silwood1]CAF1493130.1 unnamed protein product [Rotaria sp. Silwood1]CAF3634295.1 unnamed protein product [Rotaria sp. Silwood1]CAF4820936.1 unnamed protein product [Rotaria sp. Silwood1]
MNHQSVCINGKIIQVCTYSINNVVCVRFQDILRFAPNATALFFDEKELKQVPFLADRNGRNLPPLRIKFYSQRTLYCHSPTLINEDLTITLNDIREVQQPILRNIDKIIDNMELIRRQMYELAECRIPCMFIILPLKLKGTDRWKPFNWLRNIFCLYFLCEYGDNRIHFALHDGYRIKQPKAFFMKYGQHLITVIRIVQSALVAGSFLIPALGYIGQNIEIPEFLQDREFWSTLNDNLKIVSENLETTIGKSFDDINIDNAERYYRKASFGAEMRELEQYIKRVDNCQTLGNLYRYVDMNGHVRWVCKYHYDNNQTQHQTKIFIEHFLQWGGLFEEQTANAEVRLLLESKNTDTLIKLLEYGPINIDRLLIHKCILNEKELELFINKVKHAFIKQLEFIQLNIETRLGRKKPSAIIQILENLIEKSRLLTLIYHHVACLNVNNISLMIQAIETGKNSNFIVHLSLIENDHHIILTEHRLDISITNLKENILISIIEALKKNKNIRELFFINCKIGLNGIQHLANYICSTKTIEFLDLTNNNLTDECITILYNALYKNNVLKYLILKQNHIGEIGVKLLGSLKSLLTLNLDLNKIDNNGLKAFSDDFINNSKLQNLSLAKNQFNDHGIVELCRILEKNTNITYLNLSDNNLTADVCNSIAILLRENHTLTTLNLSLNYLGDQGLLILISAFEFKDIYLTEINISENNLSDISIIKLIDTLDNNIFLTHITCGMNKIGIKSIEAFQHLFLNNNIITHLSLRCCQSSLFEFEQLIKILALNNNTLTHLDLGLNELSDNCIYWLGCMQNLHGLDLTNTYIKEYQLQLFIEQLLKYSSKLIKFNLSHNRLINMKFIIDLIQKINTLRIIDLSSNRFTDFYISSLLEYLYGTKIITLQYLNIHNNRFSPEGIQRLRENIISVELIL